MALTILLCLACFCVGLGVAGWVMSRAVDQMTRELQTVIDGMLGGETEWDD